MTSMQQRHLVSALADAVALDDAVIAAFSAVDRGDFVPRYLLPDRTHPPSDQMLIWPVRWKSFERADGDSWAAQVYSAHSALVTKLSQAGLPLVSSTDPSLMAVMIRSLRPHDGDTILEIGTGTGYNAAVLSRLVGSVGTIITIDIDPEVSRSAAARLNQYPNVRAISGDGRLGYPDAAPYHGIVVTGNTQRMEEAWLTQLAPGGRIVVNLQGPMTSGIFGGESDGSVGVRGTFLDYPAVGFTPLYGCEEPAIRLSGEMREYSGETKDALPDEAALALLSEERSALAFMQLAVAADRYEQYTLLGPAGEVPGVTVGRGAQTCEVRREGVDDAEYELRAYGNRDLLRDLARAYRCWQELGAPEFWQLELNIDGTRTRVRMQGQPTCDSRIFAAGPAPS